MSRQGEIERSIMAFLNHTAPRRLVRALARGVLACEADEVRMRAGEDVNQERYCQRISLAAEVGRELGLEFSVHPSDDNARPVKRVPHHIGIGAEIGNCALEGYLCAWYGCGLENACTGENEQPDDSIEGI